MKRFKLLFLMASMLFALSSLTGCMKPYKKPIIETIETNESAVMISLIGDTENQEQAKSEQFYKDNMVYAKEVEIPQRWVQTGRLSNSGQWRPSAKLIKISRTPVSREWIDGSGGTSSKNQGFDVESKDSIGFSFGVVATAQIEEADVAKFLYLYNGRQLETIMDEEIRNHVQGILSDVATQYDLENIADMKLDAIKQVREIVIPYFEERGITITNIGLKGGLWYEDKAIQDAFNKVIVAEKERDAQVLKNEQLATKNKTENEIKINTAKAEAEANRVLSNSITSTILRMREIEAYNNWIDTWDGKVSETTLNSDSGGFIFDINK